MQVALYLIPVPISDTGSSDKTIPEYVKQNVSGIDVFIVENQRTARRFIKQYNTERTISEIKFYELNKHSDKNSASDFLADIKKGKPVGLLSEAGNPAIADPGNLVIKIAHENNIKVVPLSGPSSILMALTASGLNGQNFAFSGYLPQDKPDRIKKLKFLEKKSSSENQSQIFMEAPFRNQKMLEDILSSCNQNTMLTIACDITGESEFIKTYTIKHWSKNTPNINKIPCVFIIQA